jgi:outer membrane protein OmpA-like peptidoglycan-associated protein
MRNRVMLVASTMALVPTLLLGQQRPAQQPAQRPAQRPAAQPAPAQRPAPAPVQRMMAGPHRENTWELSAGLAAFYLAKGMTGSDNQAHVFPGGVVRVGYNVNQSWNLSAGLGVGSRYSITLLQPLVAATWTPDINQKTSPFVTAGLGISKTTGGPWPITADYGVHIGAGIRHMVGDNLALRVEARAQYEGYSKASISGGSALNGVLSAGISYFAGGRKAVANVAVSPRVVTLASLGATQQLSASPNDRGGTRLEGRLVTWTSSNGQVATVSSTGMVTARGNGSATITAASEGATGMANVTVSQTAAMLAVVPASASLTAIGQAQQLTVSARDAGSNPMASPSVTWSSSNNSVASVNASGVATAVNNGTATITASAGGRTATASVTVAQTSASVAVTPATSTITTAGGAVQFTAQAMDANGRPVAARTFTWSGDAPGVATVSPTGLATAVGNGTSQISAAVDGKMGSATLTVALPVRGVPVTPVVELPAPNASVILRNVTFLVNRAVLLPAAMVELDKIAIAMKAVPNARWEIGGYTSNTGSVARNTRLSGQRADAVKTYLVSKGVDAAGLTAMGYGPQRPIGNNRTAAGRAQNMRVEIKRLR